MKLADSLILIDLKDILISVMLTNLVMSFITYLNVLFFNNVRAKYLPRNICNNPNVLKFKELMNTSDLFTLTGIAKFGKFVIKTF